VVGGGGIQSLGEEDGQDGVAWSGFSTADDGDKRRRRKKRRGKKSKDEATTACVNDNARKRNSIIEYLTRPYTP
jgi:hypothetical protein